MSVGATVFLASIGMYFAGMLLGYFDRTRKAAYCFLAASAVGALALLGFGIFTLVSWPSQ